MIASLGLKDKAIPKKYKKARYDIGNFSKKDLSKISREFDKLPYKSYERRRPKNEPADSYFYLARQLENCMMRSDTLNSHIYPVRTEINGTQQVPIAHVYSNDKSELKEFLVDKNLLHIFSTNEDE